VTSDKDRVERNWLLGRLVTVSLPPAVPDHAFTASSRSSLHPWLTYNGWCAASAANSAAIASAPS
jgi:hypothetical protein